jgi:exosortase
MDLAEMKLRQVSIFIVVWISTVVLFWTPLSALVNLSFRDDRYVQIVVSPLLCLFLIFWERTRIFAPARYSASLGIPLLLSALLMGLLLQRRSTGETSGLAPMAAAIVMVWITAFILSFGVESFKAALFPLCCLFLTVPPPAALVDRITANLQNYSAVISHAMFQLAGVPVFVRGTIFSLPGLDIEIAPECSGIRSTLVFTLVALLVARISLRCGWRQLALVVMTAAIAIFKNAARITVIASLGAYVNRAFLHGSLHRHSGEVFAFLGVAMFVPLLSALQKSEIR